MINELLKQGNPLGREENLATLSVLACGKFHYCTEESQPSASRFERVQACQLPPLLSLLKHALYSCAVESPCGACTRDSGYQEKNNRSLRYHLARNSSHFFALCFVLLWWLRLTDMRTYLAALRRASRRGSLWVTSTYCPSVSLRRRS
jgi:hypothetical protein